MEATEGQEGQTPQSCESEPPEKSPCRYKDFHQFVQEIGPLTQTTLSFSECNRYIKLKPADYICDSKVLSYYEDTFSKKTSNALRRKWHMKDKFVLFWVVFKLCAKKGVSNLKMVSFFHSISIDWDDVASILRLPKEFLMRKWISLIRHTTCHFRWTFDEQQIFKSQMNSAGLQQKWSDLAIKIYRHSSSCILRTCKDIREHWKNYLDPKLKKEAWAENQDQQLLRLIQLNGKKWSLIAKEICGRTQNQVKNRYLALIKKENKQSPMNKRAEFSDQQSHQVSHHAKTKNSASSQDIKIELSHHEHGMLDSLQEQELQNYLPMSFMKVPSNSMLLEDV